MKTIRDIAKELHVSPSTVSKALSGSADISDETKELVVSYARKSSYMPRKYHSKEKGTVVVILGDIDVNNREQFGYEVVLGFQMAAEALGFNVAIQTTGLEETEGAYTQLMQKHNYQGAFLLGFNNDDLRMAELMTSVIPTVLLDNFIDNPKIAYVGSDNFVAYDIAVSYLERLGHRKIAFLNGEVNSLVSNERRLAYMNSIAKYGLVNDNNLYMDGDYFIDMSKVAVDQFLDSGATAILCASDVIASYVYNNLLRRGIRVPEDVSVIGYDDLPVSKYLGLTTIVQNRIDLGKIAFTVLNDIFNNVSINKLTLRPRLEIRTSTGEVKKN